MKPFLQGRKNLPVEPLRLPPGLVPPRSRSCESSRAGSTPGEESNASVEVVKEGDKVVRLAITCGCGERIEIDCLYAAGG
jgi:hypothetical protein